MKSHMMLGLVACLLAMATIVAAVPGVPHQFFGYVTVEGQPAPNGIEIIVKIGNEIVGTAVTSGGTYGMGSDPFYIEDPDSNRDGDLLEFYINDVKKAEMTFKNGYSTYLNLTFESFCGDSLCGSGETCSSCSTDCGACPAPSNPPSGGGGGGGGGSYTPPSEPACEPEWECTAWSDCADNLQNRQCQDTNQCGIEDDRPQESQPCSGPEVTGCTPGARLCFDNELMECSQTKEWTLIEDCPEGCGQGQCLEIQENVAAQNQASQDLFTGLVSDSGQLTIIGGIAAAIIVVLILFFVLKRR